MCSVFAPIFVSLEQPEVYVLGLTVFLVFLYKMFILVTHLVMFAFPFYVCWAEDYCDTVPL